MDFSLVFFIIGIIIFTISIMFALQTGSLIPFVGVAFSFFFLCIGVLKIPNYTDQQRCERSGFTWQLTDELVKSGDNYVYRGYCIDL